MVHAWRIWNPKVLAHFAGKPEIRDLVACEDELATHIHDIVSKLHRLFVWKRRSEPSLLVELLIVWDVYLWDYPKHFACTGNDGAVVELPPQFHGSAKDNDHVSGNSGCNLYGTFPSAFYKGLLEEKVSTGIARYAKFWKDKKVDALFMGLLHKGEYPICVVGAVRHLYGWCSGGNLYETVSHARISLPV